MTTRFQGKTIIDKTRLQESSLQASRRRPRSRQKLSADGLAAPVRSIFVASRSAAAPTHQTWRELRSADRTDKQSQNTIAIGIIAINL